jgi:glycosyltransferase involved in cell wall biosynthesis
MNIVIAVSGLACNGAVVYAKRIVSLLQERGHRVWLLAEKGSWIAQALSGQANIEETDFKRRPKEFRKVAMFCRREKVDVFHAHTTSAANFAAILRLTYRIRTIAHLHNNKFAPHAWFQSRVLAVSRDTLRCHQRRLVGIFGGGSVLHNFVDQTVFREASPPDRLRETLGVSPNVPVLLVVGNICRRKGQDIAVQAMPMIREHMPNVILVLIGAGALPSAFEKPYVRFLGHREDVPALLPFATTLLVPSRSEPFSLAAVEAMACGVPVIASRAGGLEEVVADGGGILVPRGNSKAFARAVIELLSNPERCQRQAAAGLFRSNQYFSVDSHLDELEEHYAFAAGITGQIPQRS